LADGKVEAVIGTVLPQQSGPQKREKL
jgi:hypothetical protein